jgi:hypothetical protein
MKFATWFIFVLVVIGLGTYWYLSSTEKEDIVIQEVMDEPVSQPQTIDEPVVESGNSGSEDLPGTEPEQVFDDPVPELENSTSWVRTSLQSILARPVFEPFFKQKEVIRTFVAAVDRLGRGENPYRQTSWLHPGGVFEIQGEVDHQVLNYQNSRRFSPLVQALESLPQDQVMAFYGKVEPLLLEAYGELGNPDSWSDSVERAFRQVDSFSYPNQPIELVGSGGIYIFKDPELEKASWVHKFLIRIGPEHAEALKKLTNSYFYEWKRKY